MKKQLRKHFLSTRVLPALVERQVCENLMKLVDKHSNIGLYMALPKEIRLDWLIDELFNRKNLYFPYVVKKQPLQFRLFHGWSELEVDEAAIPTPKSWNQIDPLELDCVVMSCVAASLSGTRLGYGGGYYDRTFANYQGILIGVVTEDALISSDFSEEFDIRLDYIVTEVRIIKIEKK